MGWKYSNRDLNFKKFNSKDIFELANQTDLKVIVDEIVESALAGIEAIKQLCGKMVKCPETFLYVNFVATDNVTKQESEEFFDLLFAEDFHSTYQPLTSLCEQSRYLTFQCEYVHCDTPYEKCYQITLHSVEERIMHIAMELHRAEVVDPFVTVRDGIISIRIEESIY